MKNDKVWYYLNNKNNSSINHIGEWWTMTGDAYNDTYSIMMDVKQAENDWEGYISGHSVLYNAKSFRPVITFGKVGMEVHLTLMKYKIYQKHYLKDYYQINQHDLEREQTLVLY